MSRKLRKIGIIIATVLLILGTLPFMGLSTAKAADTAGNEKITIGVLKNTASLPALMADAAGDFTHQNISVETKTFDSNEQLDAAIKDGTVNAAVTNLVSYAGLVSKKANADWKVAGALPGYSGLVANKKYKSIKSLKGKTIAIDKKDASKQYLLDVLKKNKMKYSSIKVKEVASMQDRVDALKAGSIDAAVLEDPLMSTAKANGGKILNRQKMTANNGSILIMNKAFAKKNTSSMQILVDTMNQEIKMLDKSGGYGMAGTALNKMNFDQKGAKVLTDLDVSFKKIHKVKKSDFNSAFKYAKNHKLYKGKISYKAHTIKIKNIK
ncbi:ABC transporter substrate-binding protein [Companilactobacillus muriivasis]|uniref:ABC transporter substrate-binding protein n=1 Tax=Companilactobacillus muriivasis TaxID=3081444 RepID=UPI0030C6A23A